MNTKPFTCYSFASSFSVCMTLGHIRNSRLSKWVSTFASKATTLCSVYVALSVPGSGLFSFQHCSKIDHVKALLAAVYNRRIQSVDDVISRTCFITMENETDTVHNLLCEQFQLRFLRWIRGVGLPRSIRDKFISAEDYKSSRCDPLVRAKMFVSSMTDMTLIPPDPAYQFTVSFHSTSFASRL